MRNKIVALFALALVCPLAVHGENMQALNKDQNPRARMEDLKDQTHFQKMIDQSAAVYSAIAKGPHGEVPKSVLDNARCIAVLPNVMTGAIVVGGSHGNGLASCKDEMNVWSQPATISLNQGSVGLQAGAKSAAMVLYFQTKDAVTALKKGNFKLGSDISAVAGKYDSTADTSGAGVVAYARTEGAFAGLSVSSGIIGVNTEDLANAYGKKIDYVALLERRELPTTTEDSEKLTKLLP